MSEFVAYDLSSPQFALENIDRARPAFAGNNGIIAVSVAAR